MKKHTLSRRAFLLATTTTATTIWAQSGTKPNTARVVPRKLSPNEKLNIAAIGCGGKGLSDIMNCSRENVVALCDVDWKRGAEAFHKLEKAKKYKDFRKMLEEMPEIDACTISTPDHTHTPAAYMAMKMGKHVYVQKPLTHTIAESRLLTETAREMGVATQMGNQGRSDDELRTTTEMIQSGIIGTIREAHIWSNRPVWPQGITKMPKGNDVPDTLDWDLWVGPAPMRPYSARYVPFKWRGWWDFGCGALGDMGCHCFNPAWMALDLVKAKKFTVEVVQQDGNNEQTGPNSSIIKYTISAYADQPDLDLYWYDGGLQPEHPEGVSKKERLGDMDDGKNGSLFIGDDGAFTCGCNGDDPRLLPGKRMKDYTFPDPYLPRIKKGNHYINWHEACKGGEPACSNFDIAGPMTEMVNMGNVALCADTKKIEWDSEKFKITNSRKANKLITKKYRKGWELPV